MNNPNKFIDTIKDFNAENINENVLDKTLNLVNAHKDKYSPEIMKSVS